MSPEPLIGLRWSPWPWARRTRPLDRLDRAGDERGLDGYLRSKANNARDVLGSHPWIPSISTGWQVLIKRDLAVNPVTESAETRFLLERLQSLPARSEDERRTHAELAETRRNNWGGVPVVRTGQS